MCTKVLIRFLDPLCIDAIKCKGRVIVSATTKHVHKGSTTVFLLILHLFLIFDYFAHRHKQGYDETNLEVWKYLSQCLSSRQNNGFNWKIFNLIFQKVCKIGFRTFCAQNPWNTRHHCNVKQTENRFLDCGSWLKSNW